MDYDFQEGAHRLFDVVNWCSANGAFTTVQATADKNSGSCWNTVGGSNRWFQFTATTAEINVELLTGGAEGTIRYAYLALWDTDGLTQLACERYTGQYSDIELDYTSLTPGNTYYISVDNHNGSTAYRGTFTLCVNDKVTYDFYERAIEITDLNSWCSANGAFTTQLATPDKNAGSCWNTAGGSNRWFTFQAISPSVTINVNTGGSEGTLRYPYVALWDSTGLVEIDCQTYSAQYSDLTISFTGLTVGHDYYISVDNHNGSTAYRGTFQLCVNNVEEFFYSIGSGSWTDTLNWSNTGHGGSTNGEFPSFGDVAFVRGHQLTLSGSDHEIAELNINDSLANTSVTIDGVEIDIRGKLNMINSGNDFDGTIDIINGGSVSVLDSTVFRKDGGANTFGLTLTDGTFIGNLSFIFDVNGGSVADNVITISNVSSFRIDEDLHFQHSGGTKIMSALDSTSSLVIDDSIYFTCTGDNQIEIELNDSAAIYIGGNFVRPAGGYGILDCNDNSTVYFQSTENLQRLPQNEGSGTGDDFTYQNLVINNTRVTRPQIQMEGPVTISGNIEFIDGVIGSSASNLLTLTNTATVTGQNTASYVEGPLKKIGSTDFLFPVGDEGVYGAVELTNMFGADAATEITAQYFFDPYSDVVNLGPGLNNVSTIEYWDISRTGNFDSTTLTLHWASAVRSVINDFDELKIVHYSGGNWINLDQDSNVPGSPGSITVSGVDGFSPYTFGSGSPLVNFLPVEFLYVNALPSNDHIEVNWGTASERESQYFEIQRSTDLIDFHSIGVVEGKGDQIAENHYSLIDENPLLGTAYYRIKQVDHDGDFQYSEVVSAQFLGTNSLSVYPNPTTGDLFFRADGISSPQLIEIRDLKGVLLYSHLDNSNDSSKRIDLSQLDPGMYILTIRGGQKELKSKFIKQ